MALIDPNEKLFWLNKLKEEDIVKALSGDALVIYQECGAEVLIKLWEKFGGCGFYLPLEPLTRLKKVYVRLSYDGTNVKLLAKELNVCESFVFKARLDNNGNAPDEPKLFSDL